MKDKIMYLIIGILIGAIITTTGFLIYNKLIIKNSNSPGIQMNGDEQMQPPPNENMEEPPAKPDGEEPPAKPNNSNDGTNV